VGKLNIKGFARLGIIANQFCFETGYFVYYFIVMKAETNFETKSELSQITQTLK